MMDLLIVLVLLAVVGGAGAYVYRAKKRGQKCIGCPSAKAGGGCSGSCAGCSGQCGCGTNNK